jgi:hypothetical protein
MTGMTGRVLKSLEKNKNKNRNATGMTGRVLKLQDKFYSKITKFSLPPGFYQQGPASMPRQGPL